MTSLLSDNSFDVPPPKSKEYMDSLVPPTAERFAHIASVQEEKEETRRRKEQEIEREQLKEDEKQRHSGSTDDEGVRAKAARMIQKTFRGYRTRREIKGYGLDASTRWVAAIREAQFRASTKPKELIMAEANGSTSPDAGNKTATRSSTVREKWKKASVVARRAGHDDFLSDSPSSPSSEEHASPEDRAAAKAKRDQQKAERRNFARIMGLRYFLEMVDQKHRHGSNLDSYHQVWKQSDTRENFFYWLDHGEGREVELESCPRDRLEREQIRYLSREDRLNYLVRVDAEGRLCWAKNGERISTTPDYKDSLRGIVPTHDPAPTYIPPGQAAQAESEDSESSDTDSSSASLEAKREADRAAKYATPEFDDTSKPKKVTHLSVSTIMNKLLRKSVKKNTWIFVADASFRLYVGIKSSGEFQHSSFLQGSRIAAAGLIKIRDGRLTSLSPLSGHYRPPAANFRAFVRSLRAAGVDMSRVSVSRSYAVLVGLEAYVKTRRKGRSVVERLAHQRDRVMAPEEAARREDEATDKSQSAAKEREVLAREEAERPRRGSKVLQKVKLATQLGDAERGGEVRKTTTV